MGDESSAASVEDEWVDRVVPESLNWKQLVQDHPLASVGAVAFVGYIVGRYQGDRLMDIARDTVKRQVDDSIGRYAGFASKRASSTEDER